MKTGVLCLLAASLLAGCTTTVTGAPVTPTVVGSMLAAGGVDVTLVSFVDPAPVYLADPYESKPPDGDRLLAAQFRIHNTSDRDYLVDPITQVSVLADGKEYDTSLAATSSGVMLDQVSLAPNQTVVGYVTLDVPDRLRVYLVTFRSKNAPPMIWQVAPNRRATPPAPWPDARKSVHGLGEQTTITDNGTQLVVAATKLTDPATPQARVNTGTGQHVVQVDFSVFENTGQGTAGDPTLRIVTLYDNADQAVNAHVYSMDASVAKPLRSAEHTTWPVQFVVPDGFKPDHVSFRPEFGNTTTTQWALS